MKKKLLLTTLIAFTGFKIYAQTWSALGSGMNDAVYALAEYNGDLYAAGQFGTAGSYPASCVAQWDGSYWNPLGTGLGGGFYPQVFGLYGYNGKLYAGGASVYNAGGVSVNNIASWDGINWDSLGPGINPGGWILTLNEYNGQLIAGGEFIQIGNVPYNYIAQWNGTSWSSLGLGVNSNVYCTRTYYESPQTYMYASGFFSLAGHDSADRVARWDGTTWTGMGLGNEFQTGVYAIAYYNGELYVGGHFNIASGSVANRIAKWNGTTWVTIGTGVGMNERIMSLAVYAGELYAGGFFSTADGVPAQGIAKWNGTSWSAVGTGINGTVETLLVFNNDLYVGGEFDSAGVTRVNNIAKWSIVGTGVKNEVKTNNISVYPNPFHSSTIISAATELKNADLVIYDMLGQEVRRISNVSGKQIIIDRDNLQSGIYTIRLAQEDNTMATNKLVITD